MVAAVSPWTDGDVQAALWMAGDHIDLPTIARTIEKPMLETHQIIKKFGLGAKWYAGYLAATSDEMDLNFQVAA